MKELIVIIGTTILGCLIFGMMITNDNSLMVALGELIQKAVGAK